MLYAGRYEAIRRVGQGGQGTVWLARDLRGGRRVALKVGRDLSEVQVPPHPGLATIHEHLIHDGEHIVVMDWVQGTTLAEDRGLPFEECLRHLDEVAAALDHLHAHGLVHGDVKPANVVVARDGQAVLVDIGLVGSAATPGYRAPERERTPAADVFALAVTATVLFTGAVPEPGAAPDWSRVPAAQRGRVQNAVETALATDPSQRPPSASAFAALLRAEDAPHNLPEESTSFVGRAFAAAEVRRLLMTSPLVTVLGPGGAGKSRLGLHVARRALPAFQGVWLAELAAASQPDLVPGRVAAAVGASGSHAVRALAELFGEDEHLLVLDTCEHVAAACAELSAELLTRCPSLRIMATSRVPLRLPQEAVWTLPPMDEREVVELFRARSGVAQADDTSIASICLRLDGMPLAVELAAAHAADGRVDVLSERIDAALRLPTASADPRHATLHATIDWSHDLLTSDEQAALRRLAVFAGGWTREAAAAACGVGDELDTLVQASLVVARGGRYRMLDTIREYASQRLAEAGETPGFLHAHATWLAELLVSYDGHFDSDRTIEAVEVLGAEHENISAALAHTLDTDIGLAATIACNAYMYWEMRGYWDEGRRWLDRIAARADELEPFRRASLLRWAASMARRQGDLELAEPWIRQAYETYESLGLKPGAASCLNQLALMAQTRQDLDEAQALFDRALQLTVELDDRRGQAILRMNASFNHVYRGDRQAAEAELLEVLAIRRELRDDDGVGDVLLNLAKVSSHFGDHGAAVPYLEEAAELYAAFGDDQGYAACLYYLAAAALDAGDRDTAVEQATQSLELARRVGDRELIGWAETLLAPLVTADA